MKKKTKKNTGTKTATATKKTVKKTVTKPVNQTVVEVKNGRGRPVGTGNYLVGVGDLAAAGQVKISQKVIDELNKIKTPCIKSFCDLVGLPTNEPFKTNKANLSTVAVGYKKGLPHSPAIRRVNLEDK